jgi:hypothetical protein
VTFCGTAASHLDRQPAKKPEPNNPQFAQELDIFVMDEPSGFWYAVWIRPPEVRLPYP